MQTHFTPERLTDPHLPPLEKILRSCVHCGFCIATCPTYLVTGDERESPRGRIYLIKDLLETGRRPEAEDVAPIDHCLSCLACMTTCPSGVDYRRLVDHARAAIETQLSSDRSPTASCARRWRGSCLRAKRSAPPSFSLASAGLSPRSWRAFPASATSSPRCSRCAPKTTPAHGRFAPANSQRRDRAPAAPRRAAHGMRPGRAGAGDQRRHDPAA